MEKPSTIEFKFGDSFDSIVKKYPSLKVTKHEAGVNFYKLFWPEEKPAKIEFQHPYAEITTEIPYVIGMRITESVKFSAEGSNYINLSAGISFDRTILHDEARLKFYEFLQTLLKQGWKRKLSFSEPRLLASQALHYLREKDSIYGLDPEYLPNQQEWMAIDKLGTFWRLHLNNQAFMTIELQRKDSKADKDTGIYLLEIALVDDQKQGRSHFSAENRTDWNSREKWDNLKAKLLSIRKGKESDLLSKGYKLDDSYVDFDISPTK